MFNEMLIGMIAALSSVNAPDISADAEVVVDLVEKRVSTRGGMETDEWGTESLARSMLNDLVYSRLNRECDREYNSSVNPNTLDYRVYLDGTTGSGRYVASTPQASGVCY